MTRSSVWVVVTATILLAATGCAMRADFTALSSKNVNLSNFEVDRSKTKGRVTGEDCQHVILFIPTSGPPTLDEAIDRALESASANLLLDAVVNWETFTLLLYGRTCWRAEGDAYDSFE